MAKAAARRELAEGYFLDRETLRRDLELYVPAGVELSDPRLSPLLAEEFAGLPPAFIHTGQFDPFGDEGEAYAQRLGGFGVAVHGRAHPGMIHYFYCMPRMIPYAHGGRAHHRRGNPLCGEAAAAAGAPDSQADQAGIDPRIKRGIQRHIALAAIGIKRVGDRARDRNPRRQIAASSA